MDEVKKRLIDATLLIIQAFFKIGVIILVLSVILLGFMLYQEFVLHICVQPATIIKCGNTAQCELVEELIKQTVATTIDVVLVCLLAVLFVAGLLVALLGNKSRNN
jgi:hypothetical protein